MRTSEENKIYMKEYYQNNKEKFQEYGKQYYEEKKEIVSARNKKYRENNSEKLKEKKRQWYKANKERILSERKKHYSENKEDISASRKEKYSGNKEYRADTFVRKYKDKDYKYGRTGFNLTRDWVIEKIFNSSCIYCGEKDWRKLGCDRIDNEKAHTTDNCVCACKSCNCERQSTPFREFLLSQNPSGAYEILSSLGL